METHSGHRRPESKFVRRPTNYGKQPAGIQHSTGVEPYKRRPPIDRRGGPVKRSTTIAPSVAPAPPRAPEIKITNELQVTDGKYKGIQLVNTASPKMRLTASRVREILFETLDKRVRFARVLDLCAGSGCIGIEAISRGALLGTFVERSAKMCHFIRLNLQACRISPGHGEIFELDAASFLKRMSERKRVWDVIYYGPSYNADYDEVLQFFARGACIREKGGVLVIEHPPEMFFPQNLGVLKRRRVIREADTSLSFYECAD